MKKQSEPQTDPILEECYRIKAEFSAQFNSIEELYDYLKAREKEGEVQGRVYIDPPPPPQNGAHRTKTIYAIASFSNRDRKGEPHATLQRYRQWDTQNMVSVGNFSIE